MPIKASVTTVFVSLIAIAALAFGADLISKFISKSDEDARLREECQKEQSAKMYQHAVALEVEKNLGSAASIFSGLCEGGNWPPVPLESPCEAAARLTLRVSDVYKQTISALSEYKNKTGFYPISIDEVLDQLPLHAREVAAHFRYCKKAHPTDRTGLCSDGATSYHDSEIEIGTGLYGSIAFTLQGPTRSTHRACEKGAQAG